MDPGPAEEYSGAYGGSRPSAPDLLAPPPVAFDGVGFGTAPPPAEPTDEEREIMASVAAEAGAMEDLLRRLIRQPSTLGNEMSGQAVMREAFEELDLVPVEVPMDAGALREHAAAAPFDWEVEGKHNLVATWSPPGPSRAAR